MVNQATRAVGCEALGWERRRPRLLSQVLHHQLRSKLRLVNLSWQARTPAVPADVLLDRPECTPHELLFQINISLVARD